MVSSDDALLEWAESLKIPTFRDIDEWISSGIDTYDYLFNINNTSYITQTVLEKANIAAINYHDSLLPRYSGQHATAWAILNQEKVHGVSWHFITEKIDGGDILKQATIPVDPEDTVLSLNIKCYEIAIKLFNELLDDITNDSLEQVPQSIQHRTYFALAKKIEGLGVINWSDSATSIYRVWRALQFGPYFNNFGSCKLWTSRQYFIIQNMQIAQSAHSATPGTILSISHESLKIATETEDIIISELILSNGTKCNMDQFIQLTNLKEGDKLPILTPALSQKITLAAEKCFIHEEYWRQQWLALNPTNLPYFLFPNDKDTKKEIQSFRLTTARHSTINMHSVESFVTLFTIYLYRLTERKEISFGLYKRPTLNFAVEIPDLFASIYPLNLTINPEKNFEEIHNQITLKLTEIANNSTFLTDIAYRYPTLFNGPISQGLPLSIIFDISSNTDEIDIHPVLSRNHLIIKLRLDENKNELQLYYSESEHLSAVALLERIDSHLEQLAESVQKHPTMAVSKLTYISKQEQESLLKPTSNNNKDHLNKSIVQHFLEVVESHPDSIAINYQDSSLTYSELNQKTNQLAAYIATKNIYSQDKVVIYLDQSEFSIIAMLALLKLNCIYIPVVTETPRLRLSHIIKTVHPQLIITNELYIDTISKEISTLFDNSSNIQIMNIDNTKLLSLPKVDLQNEQFADPNDLAYILFTSGSSGKPKGVEITHKGVVRLLKHQNYIEFKPNDIVAQLTSHNFDVSVFEIWGALLNGSILEILPNDILFSPNKFCESIKNCSILFLTPAIFVELYELVPNAFDHLRVLILGGEAVRPNYVKKILERKAKAGLKIQIINGYGPTENTVWSTYYLIESITDGQRHIPIGKPILHTDAYVLSPQGCLLPKGVPGELCLGGDGVSRGYLLNPELTHKKFIANPFSPESNTKIYRTGDYVRMDENGDLIFLGRLDNQIKIRGFRVELDEITNCLLTHPSVHQCTVITHLGPSRQLMLIAYIVLDGEKITSDALDSYLTNYLPDYMIPNSYVPLKELPLNSNQKLDQSLLPDPMSRLLINLQPPIGEEENKLAQIWSRALNISNIGRYDNYFSLGGDSIIAMQIAAHAGQNGLDIRPSDIFRYPTIISLTNRIKRTTAKHTRIIKKMMTGNVPLSPIQAWFFDSHYNKPSQYCQYILISIQDPIDKNILEKSINYILNHHDMLKASFKHNEKGWEQQIQNSIPYLKLDIVNMKNMYTIQKIEEMIHRIAPRIKLNSAPLMKAILFNTDDKSYLALVIHHLLVDRVSWRIILNDIFAAYQAFKQYKQPQLPIKTYPYKAWSSDFLRPSNKAFYKRQLANWLDSKSNFKLPIDFNQGENTEEHARIVQRHFGLGTGNLSFKKIKPLDFLITALVITLARWTNQSEIRFDMESHGRDTLNNDIDLSHTVGWFTSLYPVKIVVDNLCNDANMISVMQNVRDSLSSISECHVSYGVLRYLFDEPRIKKIIDTISHSQLCFNFLGNFDHDLDNHDMKLNFVNTPIHLYSGNSNKRRYLIEITAWIINNKLHMEWRYCSNLHNKSTIKQLTDIYLNAIQMLTSDHQESYNKLLVPGDFLLDGFTLDQFNQSISQYGKFEDIAPLSAIQQGFLYHHLYQKRSHVYNIQLIWTDKRGLDEKIFKEAWNIIIKRHSIFRSRFLWENLSLPLQVIDIESDLPFKGYDLTHLSLDEQRIQVSKIIDDDHRLKFEFNNPPLMRLTLIKLNNHEYEVVWTVHHILIGGWSFSTVMSELYTIYSSIRFGKPYHLPMPIPYTEHMLYVNKTVDQSEDQRFWTKYLRQFKATHLSQKTAHLHQKLNIEHSETELILTKELSDQLRSYAINHHNVSLNVVMLYAWLLLLSRYLDSDDILIGVVISTRDQNYLEENNIVGPLINTLPLRANFDGAEDQKAALQRIQSDLSEITDHCQTPLMNIHKWMDIGLQSELFDTLYVFENYPTISADEYVHNISIIDFNHYPLTLLIYPHQQIKLALNYNKMLISDDLANNINKNYLQVLTELMNNHNASSKKINVLSNAEMHRILTLSTPRSLNYPPLTLSQLFDQSAQTHPEKIAIRTSTTEMTYSDLQKHSNQWANYLLAQGVSRGDKVAIFIDRDIDMIVGLLAILKVGAICVPIDQFNPIKRVQFIINDTQSRYFITQLHLLEKIDIPDHVFIINMSTKNLSTSLSINAPPVEINSQDIAYIIYTSGTTGNPKGSLLKHSGLINVIYSLYNTAGISIADKILSATSISFDASILEIFGSLLYSAELIIVDDITLHEPAFLKAFIETHKPTVIFGTPSFLQMLIFTGWKDGQGVTALSGGEILTRKLSDAILHTGAKLWNHYAPSEASITVLMGEVTLGSRITLGKPIDNTRLYVLDQKMRLVPTGLPGELYIGGVGLASGYLNRPELQNQRFIQNPFLTDPSEKLYRTGDRVRLLPDGDIEYIDRIDNQIKIRGYRVELEEVRSVLLLRKEIKDAIVLTIGDSYETIQLISFYINNEDTQINEVTLKEHTMHYLPPFMVPVIFISLTEFPLTPNGKVDKKLLISQYYEQYCNRRVSPMTVDTPIENLVIKIFQQVLDRKRISIEDNYFDLGGNSISAIRLLASLQDCFSIKLTIQDILERQTPKRIALLVEKKSSKVIKDKSNIPTPIVCLQEQGHLPPLFIIHPVGGTVFWFVKLSKLLGTDRPIYALQDPGLTSKNVHFTTFEAMANFYLSEIKMIQPTGPYYLSGASFGATMAVEIAHQLLAEGETIAFLGLFDGWAVYADEVGTQNYVYTTLNRQYNDIKKELDGLDANIIKPIVDISWHRNYLISKYKLKKINCPVTLFKASRTMRIFRDIETSDNYWTPYCSELDIITVPGTHESLFYDPNVLVLADKLKIAIEYSNFAYTEKFQIKSMYHDISIDQLFEHAAQLYPDSLSAVSHGNVITYDRLSDYSNRLANHLISIGIKRGSVVGICLERGFEMLIAVLGVLKAGAVYAPILANSPSNFINIVRPYCKAIITEKSMLRNFNHRDKNIVFIDKDWNTIRNMSSQDPEINNQQSDPAFGQISLESNNKLKIIFMSHKTISRHVQWALLHFSKSELNCVAASSSLCSFHSLFELFVPLSAGCCVNIIDNILDIPTVPFSSNVSLICGTPTLIKKLIDRKTIPNSIKILILHGESFTRSFIDDIYRNTAIEKIYNSYGQDEIGTVTYQLLTKNDKGIPLLGRPILLTKPYILNQEMKIVPSGTPGELYLGGDEITDCYNSNLDMCDEKFVDNPFTNDEQKLYKTGDLVCAYSQGNLVYISQLDQKLRLNGMSVRSDGIISLFENIPGISNSAVIDFIDEMGDQHLVLYYTTSEKHAKFLNHLELIDYLKQHLPEIIIPDAFIHIDSLPMTANNQIDLVKLREMTKTYMITSKDVITSSQLEAEEMC